MNLVQFGRLYCTQLSLLFLEPYTPPLSPCPLLYFNLNIVFYSLDFFQSLIHPLPSSTPPILPIPPTLHRPPQIKELISSGAIGSPHSVHITYHRPPNRHDMTWRAAGGKSLNPGASLTNWTLAWRTDPLVGGSGGYFRDKASHQFDLLEHWFGHVVW